MRIFSGGGEGEDFLKELGDRTSSWEATQLDAVAAVCDVSPSARRALLIAVS